MPNLKPRLSKAIQEAREKPVRLLSEAEQLKSLSDQLQQGLDPVRFCIERLNFHPDPWQSELLRWGGQKMILNIARQSGKSTTAAAKALHILTFRPKALVILVAPTVKQAVELRKKIDDHLAVMVDPPKATEDNKQTLEFDNGARVVLLAADQDTVRGYSAVDLIIEDESSLVPDDVFDAMEPMLLVSKGQHLLMATPNGYRGHFSKIWHDGDPEKWKKILVTAWENPRTTKEQLDEIKTEKIRLGQAWKFAQEYECSFIAAAQGLVYPYDRQGNVCAPLSLESAHGWQFSLGIDYGVTDSTAFVVLGWKRHDPVLYVVESFKKTGLTPTEAAQIALSLTKKYPFARMVGDSGGLGKGYIEEARRRFRLPLEAAEKNNKRGFIELLVGDLKTRHLKVFHSNTELLAEWDMLPWDEEKEMPKDGYEDHLSDACLYAWRATYSYLEEARKVGPKPGSTEWLVAEAESIFEKRLAEVQKKESEWWEEESETPWAIAETATWAN